jgi:hypothetical protein
VFSRRLLGTWAAGCLALRGAGAPEIFLGGIRKEAESAAMR